MKSEQLTEVAENIFSLKHLFFKAFGKPSNFDSTITPLAYHILLQLRDKQTLSMTGVSRKLGIPKPNVTALVDKLIEKKLTERIHDTQDRRIVMIRLTKKGYDFLETTRKTYNAQVSDKLLMLPEKDLEHFADALLIVRNTLAALETIK